MILMPLTKQPPLTGNLETSIYSFGVGREKELCYIIEEAFPDIGRNGVVINDTIHLPTIKDFQGDTLTEVSYKLMQGFAMATFHINSSSHSITIVSKSALLNDELKVTLERTRCPDDFRRCAT